MTPEQVRALTPADTLLIVEGWNAAQSDSGPAAPTDDEFETLVRQYG